VSSEDEAMEEMIRSALIEHVSEGIPGPSHEVRRRVRAGMALRARSGRRRMVRVVLVVVAVAATIAIATGIAVATGVLNQPIVHVPADVWLKHFSEQHHGTTGKGSGQPGRPTTVTDAERRAGFHVRTLNGVAGAELTGVTSTTVTYRDGSNEPEVELTYVVGTVTVSAVEVRDPSPRTPLEVPGTLIPPSHVETIGGAQYLLGEDQTGHVRYIQFKTTDEVVFSVNFFGLPYPGTTGPGGVDPKMAVDVVRHLG
jgi:hypothetical protein